MPKKDINDLLQKRGEIIKQMETLLDKAENEKRDLNSEEQTNYEAMGDAQKELKKRIDRIDYQDRLHSDIKNNVFDTSHKLKINNPEKTKKKAYGEEDYRNAFDAYVRQGGAVAEGQILNALKVGRDAEGGYITPESYNTNLVEELQEINDIRKYAHIVETSSDQNIPIEDTLGEANWTSEAAKTNESSASFSQVTLTAHKLVTILKVSEELISDAFFDVEKYLSRNFGKRFGLKEEEAFINGDGNGKPRGIISDSGEGKKAASKTTITYDELLELFHSLQKGYRSNSHWILNDKTALLIRKIKDSNGQYLWQPSMQAGQPDLLFGRPVITSEAMPDVAGGKKSIVIGNLSYYLIVDRVNPTLIRLNELYAESGQVGFRMMKRLDSRVTLPAAFKHLAHAA